MSQTALLDTVTLDGGLRLAYRELGSGPPVLLLHGWPTSSLLWRNVMPAIARRSLSSGVVGRGTVIGERLAN